MSVRAPRTVVVDVLCRTCGQIHEVHGNHLYDYCETVDEELTCNICLQPLVNPMDTMCGHTFCSRCIRSVVRIHKMCPVDRKVLTSHDCRSSSLIIRRMLDRLIVVCPNTSYCQATMPRCDLDPHLQSRCPGNRAHCPNEPMGCTWHGPEDAQEDHVWECSYRTRAVQAGVPIKDGSLTTIEIHRRRDEELGINVVGGNETPMVGIIVQDIHPEGVVARDGRMLPGDQIVHVNDTDLKDTSHLIARDALCQATSPMKLTVYREKAERTGQKEVHRIQLNKVPGVPLGIKIAGRRNEPGIYVVEVLEDSVAWRDGRLIADDRVLEISGQDLREAEPERAADVIKSCGDKIIVTYARVVKPSPPDLIQSLNSDIPVETFNPAELVAALTPRSEKVINIRKSSRESLGISVSGGRGGPKGDVPIYVTSVQPDGPVGKHHYLRRGDILLSVNGQNLWNLSHIEAVKVLKSYATCKALCLKIVEADCQNIDTERYNPTWLTWLTLPSYCQTAHTVCLEKVNGHSLGFSIVGGNDSSHGNHLQHVTIYVKTLVPNGVAAKSGQLKCGDQILMVNGKSLANVSHTQAVSLLKQAPRKVEMTVISWPGTMV